MFYPCLCFKLKNSSSLFVRYGCKEICLSCFFLFVKTESKFACELIVILATCYKPSLRDNIASSPIHQCCYMTFVIPHDRIRE